MKTLNVSEQEVIQEGVDRLISELAQRHRGWLARYAKDIGHLKEENRLGGYQVYEFGWGGVFYTARIMNDPRRLQFSIIKDELGGGLTDMEVIELRQSIFQERRMD